MTPQAMLRACFSELADSMGITLSVRRQAGKYYFTVVGAWENTRKFMASTFPEAWMTSSAGDERVYGLPIEDVERALLGLQLDPAWLHSNDKAPLRIARKIREESAFDQLPVLADALEEAGCDHTLILDHCRSSAPHQRKCWVVELLLGPDRRWRSDSPDWFMS
jgi:hypothetical protein